MPASRLYNHAMRLTLRATLFAAALALSQAGCAAQQHTLKLSEVSTGLRPYENSPYDALLEKPVYYSEIGEPEYDRFFQEAAAVYGSMLFAVHTVERMENVVAGKARATPADVAVLFTLVTDTLPRTQQRAFYLLREGQRLRDKAGSDFWWRPFTAWKVRGAVSEARANLEETRRLIPVLVERVDGLKGAVGWHKLLEKSL